MNVKTSGNTDKTIILATDVFYDGGSATAAGVIFCGWRATNAKSCIRVQNLDAEKYVSGMFSVRELPCILALIKSIDQSVDIIIIDGYVWLGPEQRAGLGANLFYHLADSVPVIGVAKTRYRDTPCVEVFRGKSKSPLYVTAAGMSSREAGDCIGSMAGEFRIPTMLKQVDLLSRS